MDVDDSWTMAYIDFDMDYKTGYVNFIKNEEFTKDEHGTLYYEFDSRSIDFDMEFGRILRTTDSHEKDYA